MLETGELTESSSLLRNPAELRRRADEDGYLFLRGLLTPAKVLEVRRQIVDILIRHGLARAGADPGCETSIPEAIAALPREQVIEQCITLSIYKEIMKLERFHALPHDPALLALFGALFGEPPLVHARHIARVIMPAGSFFPTPPHQDFPLVQGTTAAWTCWIPLADTPAAMGPLAVLKGSHKHGLLERSVTTGAGGVAANITGLPSDWASTDFEAGDVLAFSSLTVHRALPQADKARVRLSLDARYQPSSQPVHALSLRPHSATYVAFGSASGAQVLPSWEEVYDTWSDEALEYYWRNFSPTFAPFDTRLLPVLDKMNDAQRSRLEALLNEVSGL